MNQVDIKETLQVDHRDCSWVDLLPTALLRLRMTPQSQGYSPYEIVYGRPPPIIKQVSTNLPQVRGNRISQQMELLLLLLSHFSRVRLFATPWTEAYQAPLSMGFSRQAFWNSLPFPSPGDLPIPRIKPKSPAL